MENYNGVKLGRTAGDFIAGEYTPITPSYSIPKDKTWTDYKPEHEIQFLNAGTDKSVETSACVSFSATDVLESIFTFLIPYFKPDDLSWLHDNGYFKNGKINFSDRYIAIKGDTKKDGAYQYKVANAIQDWGLIPETLLPSIANSFDEYHNSEVITKKLEAIGLEFIKRFPVKWQWIQEDKESILEALTYSPLQVVVKYADGDGILDPTGYPNHAVMLSNYLDAYSEINDSYWRELKKYKNDKVYSHLAFYLDYNFNNTNMFIPENNKVYMLVEGPEQKLAMGLDGKLVIFPNWSICRENAVSRSKVFEPAIPITLEKWNSANKVNSKGEIIN